jgi:hypothetical protein
MPIRVKQAQNYHQHADIVSIGLVAVVTEKMAHFLRMQCDLADYQKEVSVVVNPLSNGTCEVTMTSLEPVPHNSSFRVSEKERWKLPAIFHEKFRNFFQGYEAARLQLTTAK